LREGVEQMASAASGSRRVAPQRVRDRLFRALKHTEPDGARHKVRTFLRDFRVLRAAGEREAAASAAMEVVLVGFLKL
jgi:hypothetical protein